MEPGKRCKNFTEREKMLLIEVAKEFSSIIDNKKTDGPTVEAKKQAWSALTNKYNANSETGIRTEKQLHALYDNLKKKARKSMGEDKPDIYKTWGCPYIPKTNIVEEKVEAVLSPQFKMSPNEFEQSAPYYSPTSVTQVQNKEAQFGSPQDFLIVTDAEEDSSSHTQETSKEPQIKSSVRPISPLQDSDNPKVKRMCLTEIKKKNLNNICKSLIKRKSNKQINENLLTTKKMEILELQWQQEKLKLEKAEVLLNIEIELKKVLLETAKIEMEVKKKNATL